MGKDRDGESGQSNVEYLIRIRTRTDGYKSDGFLNGNVTGWSRAMVR